MSKNNSVEIAYQNAKDLIDKSNSIFLASGSDLNDETIEKIKNEDLKKFVKTLEKVCVETVENGSMTKDLAILIDANQKYLTTNQFLDSIDGNLKKKLN